MRATKLLMEEHELILRCLSVLGRLADQATSGAEVSQATVQGVLEFLSGFADAHHHLKEEDILFPAMHEAGFPRGAGPVAVMLHEHDQGRRLISALREAAPLAGGDAKARARFADTARAYAALLSAHIEKENNILFRMADQAIQGDGRQRVEEAFDRYEEGAVSERARLVDNLERVARTVL